jgi:hypothetical protein
VLHLVALSTVHAVPKGAEAWTKKHPKTLLVSGQELRRSHTDANLLAIVNLNEAHERCGLELDDVHGRSE